MASGGGRNGQVAGYRIGGKTGTADKTGTNDVVVSFMCFAPADDPQYIMLLTMDTPSRHDRHRRVRRHHGGAHLPAPS